MRYDVLSCAAVVAVAGGASGQSNATFRLKVSNVVTPSNPEATVSVFAAWEQGAPGEFVFTGANLDLVAGDGEFSDVEIILQLTCMCGGTTLGNRVNGLSIGQIHLPPVLVGLPDNPIHLYDIKWTATDFTPRTVGLNTENTVQFRVAPAPGGATIDLMATFRPGSGSIRVVPGVGGVGLLALGGAMVGLARCRRRV